MLATVPIFLWRGALIDPLPLIATILGALAGGALGVLLVLTIRPDRAWPFFCLMVCAPITGGIVAAHHIRIGAELAAFAGANVTRFERPAVIESVGGGARSYAMLRLEPGARSIRVRITPDLAVRLDPRRAPGRDCLMLKVETGRRGVRRTEVPALFDPAWDVDRLLPCPAAAS